MDIGGEQTCARFSAELSDREKGALRNQEVGRVQHSSRRQRRVYEGCACNAQGLTATTTRCVLRSAPAHVVTLGSNEHPSYIRSLWQSFIATNTFDAAL